MAQEMNMVMSIQTFFEKHLLPAIEMLTEEERADFREQFRASWLPRTALPLTPSDEQWLRRIKIDPAGVG